MRTFAVLPVKSFGVAKQRLAADLGGPQPELTREMVSRVLAALSTATSIDSVIVVTREPALVDLVAEHGAELVDEPALRGHSAAALLGVQPAVSLGADRVLLAAGDCPLLTANDVDDLLTRHRGAGVAILADRHGTGTNGLLLAPPDAIAPAFGPGSCERHAALAEEAGAPWVVESIPAFELDVDTADDLAAMRSTR